MDVNSFIKRICQSVETQRIGIPRERSLALFGWMSVDRNPMQRAVGDPYGLRAVDHTSPKVPAYVREDPLK